MSMTREEVIERLEQLKRNCHDLAICSPNGKGWALQEMSLSMALTALRGPTREMVERMRYPWERIIDAYGNTEGYLCECGHMDNSASNFCRYCGLPKTDEAVEMVMERMEEMKNG